MKLFKSVFLTSLLLISSSCALMMNDKNDQVSINSSPSGADIFIDGKHYGQTPANLNIEAKNSTVVLTKEGYGSTQLQIEAWASIKNSACSADMLGAILILPLYSMQYSGKCNTFKEKEYFVTIPRTGGGNSNRNHNNASGYRQNYNQQYRR